MQTALDRPRPAASATDALPLHVQPLGLIAYASALAVQESQRDALIAGQGEETLLLLEHPSVYTLGRGADAADLCGAPARLGVPVFRVGRGGGATYHGPGQMVGYPIVRLRANGRDVHGYIRRLEAALVDTCAHYGVAAATPAGQTGVWVGDRKLAAIGIGVRRGVAFHGVALNVSTDLSYFQHIVPCRAAGMAVTSLAALLGAAPPLTEVGAVFAARLAARLGFAGIAPGNGG
jgi:lipoyl(octanoyl) transferase